MASQEQEIKIFKGVKNDENEKNIPMDYFFKIINWNYPKTGILGLDSILFPARFKQFGTTNIDGEYEYRYLDQINVLRTEHIIVTNGTIRKTDLVSTDVVLKSGLTVGKCSFTTFQDKLLIANGKDYVQVYDGSLGVVSEMGAPFATQTDNDGNDVGVGSPNGVYYYAVTYTTSGGEDVIGSVSNTITVVNHKVFLNLPIGYDGTLSRSIYRTTAGGSILYKIADLTADNSTLTYTDNIDDSLLVSQIPANKNELPRPYFLVTAGQKLFGIKNDRYPTQIFITSLVNGAPNNVFDLAVSQDISDYANDDTAVEGGGIDYNKVIVGSHRNMFLIDPNDNSCVLTRANVGIKSGYSCVSLPQNGTDFTGGLMFLSTLNDIRLMSGSSDLIPMTLNDVVTDNWGQNIRGDLENELKTLTTVDAAYFDYKYHLLLNKTIYSFDIRVQGWTEHKVKTTTYESQPVCLAVMNGQLYNGQPDGWVEQCYQDDQYRGEDVECYLESPYIAVSDKYKFMEKIKLWFVPSVSNSMTVNVITDDNETSSQTQVFTVLAHSDFGVLGGAFNKTYFSKNYFNVDLAGMDYRVVHINQTCRWLKWTLSLTKGGISLQKITFVGQVLENQERA